MIVSRRWFTVITAVVLIGLAGGCAKQQSPVVFAVAADVQYCDKDTVGSRHYRQSLAGLQRFVESVNQRADVDFAIELGDIIDGGQKAAKELEQILAVYAGLRCPRYYVMGNHEFVGLDRTAVLSMIGLEKGYYRFDKQSVRFIVLDTVELENADTASKQLDWLNGQLTDACKKKLSVIVLGHYPITPPVEKRIAKNADAVRDILNRYGCVRAYVCGHNHAGGYLHDKGIHYLTLPAMVDDPNADTWAMMTLWPDRLDITGYGNVKNQTLMFDK